MGIFKAKEPGGPKESVRPSIMVVSSTDPLSLETPSEDAPQATSYPLVKARKGSPITMLEVFKPSPKRAVHIGNNAFHRVPVGSPRFRANGFLQLYQTLLPRPSSPSLKMIPKEVKPLARGAHVYQSCLLGMQPESFLHHLPLQKSQRLCRFLPTATQDDQIIRIAHHPKSSCCHRSIHRVQIQVRQQWTDDRPLGGPLLRTPLRQSLHDPLFQEHFQQPQHPPIPNVPLYLFEQWLMENAVEVAIDVRIHDPYVSRLKKPVYLPQGVLASASRSKPIASGLEYPLENGFDHQTQRCLNHSVSYARNTQRPLVQTPWLLNVDPSNRSGLIASGAKLLLQLMQILFQIPFKSLKTLVVRPYSPFVRLYLEPSLVEGLGSVYLIDQTKPYASFHSLFESLQHALRPDRTFHPAPLPGPCVSCLFSLLQHFRRSLFVAAGLHPSTSLHPFAPQALPRFTATMGAVTPARQVLGTLTCGNERPPRIGQVSLLHSSRPSMHSVTKHLTRPATASPLPAQRDRLPGLFSRSGLHPESAGSSLRTAESCSSSYGLHVRFRLLPTPPHGDAVAFDYQERASPERGLSPLRSHLLAGAQIPAFAGMTVIGINVKKC